LLGKGASVDEVSKCLWSVRTVRTVGVLWSKMADAIAKRKSIHKKLVMGLLMARKERATPNSLPDVQRWNSQLGDSMATPIQRLRDPLQTVQKASCACRSESAE